jgi:hypothetical protein
MASETEPNSTSTAEKSFVASPSTVRLQGGGLRFLDAHEIPQLDYNVVTRSFQNNNTQHWRLVNLGGNVYMIQQVSNGNFLDAHEIPSLNFRVVTRWEFQNNDTQRWRLLDFGGGFFQIQQVSSGRFLAATLDGDFQVVTGPADNDLTTWRLGDP